MLSPDGEQFSPSSKGFYTNNDGRSHMNANHLSQLANRVMAGLAALNLAAGALFLTSFSLVPASASQSQESDRAQACSGVDLLDKLKTEDPEKFSTVLAKAKATPNGEGLFWRVTGKGEASYLFGTMHSADPDIATLKPELETAIRKTRTTVIETTDILDPEATARTMGQIPQLTLLQNGDTLTSLVDPKFHTMLEKELDKRGMPIAMGNMLQPWIVSTMLSVPMCSFTANSNGEGVLDAVIANTAKADGDQIVGLETIREQFEAMASLPMDFQISAIEAVLADDQYSLNALTTLKELYMKERIGYAMPFMAAISPESYSGENQAKFQEALVDIRNKRMVERLIPLLEEGSVLAAIGALHLPGETGMIALLEKKGFKLERIQ